MIEKAPIAFTPYLKQVIWGGDKICKYKNIPQPEPNIGESWEVSAMPNCESVVSQGQYKGMLLSQLTRRFGAELLGDRVVQRYYGKFPLLVKFIDAAENLSVQVHPGDDLAMKRHNCFGKTEMWYIIQADKGAKIYSGFNAPMTAEDYVKRVANGSFAESVAVHDSMPGDVFFLPPGRVHAIGKGNLLAEIQEASDITYRIYDYNRMDDSGNQRQLHTLEAKDAIDFTVGTDYKSYPAYSDDVRCEIAKCEHFTTDRILLNGEMVLDFDPSSFSVLMCLRGSLTIIYPGGEMPLTAGHTVLVPAVLSSLIIQGVAEMLLTHV